MFVTRITALILTGGVALGLLAGCGHSSPSAQPGPAQMLADLDGDRQPVAVYQHALNALGSLCTQSESDVAGLVNATLDDLRKNGVRDETELSVLQHLAQAVPAGQRTDCQSVAAAYAVTREGPA